MTRKSMVIDIDKCIGCHSCAVVCKQENNVGIGVFWNKVLTVGPHGKYPNVEMYYLPVMCQHCEKPACVEVCPTGASYRREDGVVLVNHNKCIGCRYCVMACPYSVRSYSEDHGVIEKCTLCAHRTDGGNEVPACSKHCPGAARIFGDLDDPKSAISQAISAAGKENVHKFADVDNHPSVSYILHGKKWRD